MTADEPFTAGADTSDDLERRARAILPHDVFEYVSDGGGDQRAVAANRAGYGRYRLLPRVLIEVSNNWRSPAKGSWRPPRSDAPKDMSVVDTSVEILGTKLAAPIFTCPAGGMSLVHRDGELGVARAAKAAGIGFMLTTGTSVSLEDAAAVAGPARWQQVYWQGNRMIMADLSKRVHSAGYKAMVLTVDNPMRPTRRRTIRSGFRMPAESTSGILGRYASEEWMARLTADEKARAGTDSSGDFALTWKNVEWLKSQTEVPFVIKGIMSAQDALHAVSIGIDGIIISNHGGRSLDGVPGTIEVLERIIEAVDGRIPVLIDGGVRSTTDVAIALALGAAAVGIGRPVFWALACGGEEVLTAYLEDMVEELGRTFGMLGVTSVPLLTRSHVSRVDEFLPDSALSRFIPPQ